MRELPPETFKDTASPSAPRRRVPFLVKLLVAFTLLVLAWLGFTAYRRGGLPDLTSPAGRAVLAQQLKTDLRVSKEQAGSLAQDVRQRLGGAKRTGDPSVPEKVSAQLGDLQAGQRLPVPGDIDLAIEALTQAGSGADGEREGDREPALPVVVESREQLEKLGPDFAAAQEHYRRGLAAHAATDPARRSPEAEQNLQAARAHFAAAVRRIAAARKNGFGGVEVDVLERTAAARWLDCERRLAPPK
jgi:hypothetical protein